MRGDGNGTRDLGSATYLPTRNHGRSNTHACTFPAIGYTCDTNDAQDYGRRIEKGDADTPRVTPTRRKPDGLRLVRRRWRLCPSVLIPAVGLEGGGHAKAAFAVLAPRIRVDAPRTVRTTVRLIRHPARGEGAEFDGVDHDAARQFLRAGFRLGAPYAVRAIQQGGQQRPVLGLGGEGLQARPHRFRVVARLEHQARGIGVELARRARHSAIAARLQLRRQALNGGHLFHQIGQK